MRTREEIEESRNKIERGQLQVRSDDRRNDLILELLLDIRDLLQAKLSDKE